jgi:hypothetical protein
VYSARMPVNKQKFEKGLNLSELLDQRVWMDLSQTQRPENKQSKQGKLD